MSIEPPGPSSLESVVYTKHTLPKLRILCNLFPINAISEGNYTYICGLFQKENTPGDQININFPCFYTSHINNPFLVSALTTGRAYVRG